MAVLTREQIEKAQDIKQELVPVPEWGGEVWVKALTGTERDAFEASSIVQRDKSHEVNLRDIRARLCSFAICDEAGKRLFGAGDIEALGKKSAAALTRVYEVAERLSGLTKKDVEELEKNSVPGPSGGSGSSCSIGPGSPCGSCSSGSAQPSSPN